MAEYISKTAAKNVVDDWYKKTGDCFNKEVSKRPCCNCDFSVLIPYVTNDSQIVTIPICELFHKIFAKEVE